MCPAQPPDIDSALLDLSGVTVADLDALDSGALAECLRRVLGDHDRRQDVVAGFQSSI
ncbi:FxSxx-COOH cyclophane-containing RiPP peptide [Nonomuraea sp. NBC_01738]|uniref:FxSxx-COOH cyclophane-containing RiPP peptide n=1 Tax=Nonomuraea sp. NBC_01738 TaxID=2976003 RepID=UPI003FA366A3